MHIRGIHLIVLAAVVLGGLAVRATESYASQYQSLPVLDWLEARPPLAESTQLPAAGDLARGLLETEPLLLLADDVRPFVPVLAPPGVSQRMIGGVRDAATLQLASPQPASTRVKLELSVAVFYRALRAEAWAELLGRELDRRDPTSGASQIRVSGPDQADGVWITSPGEGPPGVGEATVVGARGPIVFELRAQSARAGAEAAPELVDLSARAESIAREAATNWTAWLAQQSFVADR